MQLSQLVLQVFKESKTTLQTIYQSLRISLIQTINSITGICASTDTHTQERLNGKVAAFKERLRDVLER